MSGASTNKYLRATKQIVAELGMRVVEVDQSKHLRILIECNGQRRLFVAAVSPSDRNVLKVQRSLLRRMAAEMSAVREAA